MQTILNTGPSHYQWARRLDTMLFFMRPRSIEALSWAWWALDDKSDVCDREYFFNLAIREGIVFG